MRTHNLLITQTTPTLNSLSPFSRKCKNEKSENLNGSICAHMHVRKLLPMSSQVQTTIHISNPNKYAPNGWPKGTHEHIRAIPRVGKQKFSVSLLPPRYGTS
ncbi:hypothetical protein POVWA2_029250 [Plasmodium ovale wallikeri]|uniref:Uncharacterized protein n=1 Tax=Plasmodium ovale wallikeri TaxID=864142 RepID=A0A1A8YXJ8_PLAOA|nr:hypothetical protein POVWA2_029250 [Plasmodium ovale wallikeri]